MCHLAPRRSLLLGREKRRPAQGWHPAATARATTARNSSSGRRRRRQPPPDANVVGDAARRGAAGTVSTTARGATRRDRRQRGAHADTAAGAARPMARCFFRVSFGFFPPRLVMTHRGPRPFLDVGVEVVVPALAALLRIARAAEARRDQRQAVGAEQQHKLPQAHICNRHGRGVSGKSRAMGDHPSPCPAMAAYHLPSSASHTRLATPGPPRAIGCTR